MRVTSMLSILWCAPKLHQQSDFHHWVHHIIYVVMERTSSDDIQAANSFATMLTHISGFQSDIRHKRCRPGLRNCEVVAITYGKDRGHKLAEHVTILVSSSNWSLSFLCMHLHVWWWRTCLYHCYVEQMFYNGWIWTNIIISWFTLISFDNDI